MNPPRTCSLCPAPFYARSRCRHHYGKLYHLRPDLIRRQTPGAVCCEPGCGQPVSARGRCARCYGREWRRRKLERLEET